jgi:hypothetical protein
MAGQRGDSGGKPLDVGIRDEIRKRRQEEEWLLVD